jgi:amino acid transporter
VRLQPAEDQNYIGVRWWGESEFVFACLKIFLVIGLSTSHGDRTWFHTNVSVIGGLVIDLGGGPTGERIGFRYWKDPGPVKAYHSTGSLGYFLAWFKCLQQASYSFTSIEQISIAAAEVKNPRVAVAKACRRIIWRIMIFYMCGILIVGMLVSSNDKELLADSGTAATSPFVLAFERAGVKALPSIINAIVMTSAFSAANSGLYAHSRCLYGLSLRRQAPAIFARCDKRGTPYVSLFVNAAFLALGFLGVSTGAATVLNWLVNITTLTALVTWAVICATYLRFYQGLKAQAYDRDLLRFKAPWQPWPVVWSLFWLSLILLFNGWEVFTNGHWKVTTFIVDYITFPVFGGLICIWLVWKRERWAGLKEIDFVTGIPTDAEVDIDEKPPTTWYGKLFSFLFT